MMILRSCMVVGLLAFAVGCGGDSSKGAVQSANPTAKPPSGTTTVTNADGTTSETASNNKIQDPVE